MLFQHLIIEGNAQAGSFKGYLRETLLKKFAAIRSGDQV